MANVTIEPTTAASSVRAAVRSLPQQQASDIAAKPGPTYAAPTLRLDADLGLVVTQFYNASGSASSSVPNSQQLKAYQQWTVTGHGSNPLSVAA